MAFRIYNNVQSLNALRNLNLTQTRLGRSLEKLSSGLKVNTGKDGPAALVISEKLRAQIAGLGQAIDNSEQAMSLVQLAEGALAEVNTLLTSIRLSPTNIVTAPRSSSIMSKSTSWES